MTKHSIFDQEHIKTCDDCYNDHQDFIYEQQLEAELDALSEQYEEENN